MFKPCRIHNITRSFCVVKHLVKIAVQLAKKGVFRGIGA